MGRSGRLSLGRFGASMPVTSPAVQEPPFHYRDAELLSVAYETDAEPVATCPVRLRGNGQSCQGGNLSAGPEKTTTSHCILLRFHNLVPFL